MRISQAYANLFDSTAAGAEAAGPAAPGRGDSRPAGRVPSWRQPWEFCKGSLDRLLARFAPSSPAGLDADSLTETAMEYGEPDLGSPSVVPARVHPVSPPVSTAPPLVSVIIINYNGAAWLERCIQSLHAQTIFAQLEIIVADNASPDHSDRLAAELMQDWANGRTVQLGTNLGYSGGNNRAAEQARGRYLFFLNNDTWLEPDCLERLMAETQASGAGAAAPLVMDYLENHVQSVGSTGFDVFGLLSGSTRQPDARDIFVAEGCSLLIEAELFRRIGGFDPEFFMYADEYDLCWRVWLAGRTVTLARSARLHHRGAAAVNPLGCQQVIEARTSDSKRFYANRNNLLVLLKNGQHLLLLLVPLQVFMLGVEALAMWVLTRRWSHVRRAYGNALIDCWRLRRHILAERRRLRPLRRHGDLWMLRFLRGRFNRLREIRRFRRFGLPKVDAK